MTVPLLSPTIFFAGVISTIYAFQAFGAIDILIGQPYVVRLHTNVLIYNIINTLQVDNNAGAAAIMATVLFLITAGPDRPAAALLGTAGDLCPLTCSRRRSRTRPAPRPGARATPQARRGLRTIGSYVLLTVGAIIILFPIYVTIVNSLLPTDQLVHQPPPLFPTNPQWHDYSAAWNGGQMSKYMATSAIMTAIIVVGQLVTSVFAAYAFAFLTFPFKRTLFVVCLWPR